MASLLTTGVEDLLPGLVDRAQRPRSLPVEDRALLALRYVAGLNSTELGRATGMSASGTRARLARLLDRLRSELFRPQP